MTLAANSSESLSATVFYKICSRYEAARRGATLVSQYYPCSQEPFITSTGLVIYPSYDGKTQAELPYHWCRRGHEVPGCTQKILDIELRKAEDTLEVYRRSMRRQGAHRPDIQSQQRPIHRYFCDRMASEGTRLQDFYGSGIRIQERDLHFDQLMSLRLDVNGIIYPSLRDISARAAQLLDPESASLAGPVVFGLGDGHGGNVMTPNRGPCNEVLYIDYEVAGFHSLVLDLAKPLYNDVFFRVLMAGLLGSDGEFSHRVDQEVLHVRIGKCTDSISRAIPAIKKRHLIEPLQELANSLDIELDDYAPRLAHALFSCALLTRNYAGHLEALMRSIAVGTILSQAVTLDDLWHRCDSIM